MGITQSNQLDINKQYIPENILNQIKNKDHSVVTFNDYEFVGYRNSGNIMVNQLYEAEPTSTDPVKKNPCKKLPDITYLKDGNSIHKNIYITSKNKNIRLYANSKCTIRANEEAYATVARPEKDLFSPNYQDPRTDIYDVDRGSKDQAYKNSYAATAPTKFTFVPFKKADQNALYYKISDKPINTPRIPQFYIKNRMLNGTIVDGSKQFVEYDDELDDNAAGNSICRKIPTERIPESKDPMDKDFYFMPKPGDSKLDNKGQWGPGRQVGVDRFPDYNSLNNAKTFFQPITIYTDVDKDKNGNPLSTDSTGARNAVERGTDGRPVITGDTRLTCKNIYIPSIKTSGDRIKNGKHVPASPNDRVRDTPIPYTTVKNYGTLIAGESNSFYYELKDEPGILD